MAHCAAHLSHRERVVLTRDAESGLFARPDRTTEPLSLGPSLDDGWEGSQLIQSEAGGSAEDATAILGPLQQGVAYHVRLRAYAHGKGCAADKPRCSRAGARHVRR